MNFLDSNLIGVLTCNMSYLKNFKLDFFIGGFSGDNIKIKNNGNELEVGISDNPAPNPMNIYSHLINNNQWQEFWEEIDEQGIWNWKNSYTDNTIRDGTQWELNLEKDGKIKKTWGSNDYPENFDMFIKSINKIAKTSISDEDY